MAEIFVVVSGLWLAVVVATNLWKLARPATRLPPSVPDFRLFAPLPLDREYLFFSREVDASGNVSSWAALPGLNSLSPAVLRRRAVKLGVDCADQLLRHHDRHGSAAGCRAHQLLVEVCRLRYERDARVQFAVVSPQTTSTSGSPGNLSVQIVYVSQPVESDSP